MQYIDEKFKEARPEDTVARIKGILDHFGIETEETWHDSGLDNCYSLSLSGKSGVPSSNGKGVTREFARASAYGEFIERLQGGLHFYKYQSIVRDPGMNLQRYAPDAKYMTLAELEENGEWMDYIIRAYPHLRIDRKNILKYCSLFACADDGKILTLPFYSLFEKKYIYLPIDFVDQVYATNGCCVGNSRDEAWVHALSEIIERHANLTVFTSGQAAPKFSADVINRYPVVSNILKQIRKSGDYDIDIFDYSMGSGFPVVSTRIIDKKSHSYRVNVAADPVFEIALQRTLTELFQGRNINNFVARHGGTILNHFSDFPPTKNVVNQLETGNGVYTADFFADEVTCDKTASTFEDNSGKNNKQLLAFALNVFRRENRQIYVRNFSYLGFPCYRFVVPGYSEALALKLAEPVVEAAIGDQVAGAFRNPMEASDDDLRMLLSYSNMIKPMVGRYNHFGRIAGLPMKYGASLASITRSYAAYRLKAYEQAINFLKAAMSACGEANIIDYLACISKYIELEKLGVSKEKVRSIIYKFFKKTTGDRLYSYLDAGVSPYGELLLSCDLISCDSCKDYKQCNYKTCKELVKIVGGEYLKFVNGQDEDEFTI